MTIAVLADAHLGGPGGRAEPLVEQLEGVIGEGCEHLVFLGDLFHVWVGDRRYETREIRQVVPAIRSLRRQGLEITYVEGNRDFFLEDSCYADAFDRVVREVRLEHAGVRYLAVHGDGLNDRDWRYRFWRWLSKSSPSRALFRRLPGPIARRIVGDTEARLARTNFEHKRRIPLEVIEEYGRRRLAEGCDVVLLGHFHEARTVRLLAGEVRILDAWFNSHQIEWLGLDTARTGLAAAASEKDLSEA